MSKGSFRLAVTGAVAFAAVAALTGFARPTVVGAPAAFRTADGSTACAAFASGDVACRTRGARRALVLHRDGRTDRADIRFTWTRQTPVLLSAESWWRGDTVCRTTGARVRCAVGAATIALG